MRFDGVELDTAPRAGIDCLVSEIPDGSWGFVGQTITRESAEKRLRELAQ